MPEEMARPITDQQIADIAAIVSADDLPGDLAEIAEYIGVQAALKLAARIGCGRIYLRKWTNDRSRWSKELTLIIETIGQDKAIDLLEVFGGSHIDIPKCDKFWRAWRNKAIREATGRVRQVDLARAYGLTDRQIRTIQKQPATGQPSLFEDL